MHTKIYEERVTYTLKTCVKFSPLVWNFSVKKAILDGKYEWRSIVPATQDSDDFSRRRYFSNGNIIYECQIVWTKIKHNVSQATFNFYVKNKGFYSFV